MNPDPIRRPRPDHPIAYLMAHRWSPYAFADRPVSDEDLRSLFEAARWSASSYNEQPWSYIVATKADPAAHEAVLSCLNEANRAWAGAAPVLAIGCASLRHARDGRRNDAAEHDLGAASAAMALQATAMGMHVHQMIGILPDRAREAFRVPEGVLPFTGLAIGYLGDPASLPEHLRPRDLTPKGRRPLAEFVFGGAWGETSPVVG